MSTTLLLLPADAGAAATAVHVDAQGHVHVHGTAASTPPAARTVLVVPGTQVHLRWLACPGAARHNRWRPRACNWPSIWPAMSARCMW